jgi:predicted enzyme related to lactoylglutathione lyase
VAGLAPGHGAAEWRITVQVEDCARAAEVCARLGGIVAGGPADAAPGRYADLIDPFGAGLRVMSVHESFRTG